MEDENRQSLKEYCPEEEECRERLKDPFIPLAAREEYIKFITTRMMTDRL